MSIAIAERLRKKLQESLNILIKRIGKIQIGTTKQFPFGWGNAAKGRTVWRILEEVIIQNLRKNYAKLGISSVTSSASEVSIYDFSILLNDEKIPIYVNVKSAVSGGRTQRDDISKGEGLHLFYKQDKNKHFFVATFFIKFNEDMSIEIEKCVVFPVAWIPDVYVNPSNNGNLQSAKYKNIKDAEKRTPIEFYKVFKKAMAVAMKKKDKKRKSAKRRKK